MMDSESDTPRPQRPSWTGKPKLGGGGRGGKLRPRLNPPRRLPPSPTLEGVLLGEPLPRSALCSSAMTPPLEEDMERVLWTEAEISARVSELASEISRDLEESAVPVAVVGVATGAFLFLADIVRRVALPVTVDFIRVESYDSGTESSGAPRISSDVKVDVEGKHVVLVEDIVDTGNTLSCLIPHMKSKGACAVSVCTFLDKPVRRKVHFELFGNGKFYRGFECPDYFVVGYGMDFAELYRNLPFIGVLKEEKYQL